MKLESKMLGTHTHTHTHTTKHPHTTDLAGNALEFYVPGLKKRRQSQGSKFAAAQIGEKLRRRRLLNSAWPGKFLAEETSLTPISAKFTYNLDCDRND